MATTKKKKKTRKPLSLEDRAKKVEQCRVIQAKAAYEKTVIFRVVVDHFVNKKAVVRFEYKDDRYRPSRKRMHQIWHDIASYYKHWQYSKKKEELPILRAEAEAKRFAEQLLDTAEPAETAEQQVINELDEVLANG